MEEDVLIILTATAGAIFAIVFALLSRNRKKPEKENTIGLQETESGEIIE